MKPKKADIIVIIAVSVIVFGGLHLMKNKKLDPEAVRISKYAPPAESR
ncbi:MAG: hypothetical protein KKA05_01575 [Alphaproteobacteria bacterium]|nr:hypothetical protein [Alphaproteobacteria bacterium]MBU0858305.1 hypothetical protein [Alphaproteobacteria bacterium]